LAFLVDGDDDGVSGRVHVEADDILDLLGEIWIVGALESADAMRLQAMRFPQALDGAKRYAGGLGHGAPGPMGDLARRFGTGQLQNLRDNFRRERGLAGFARLVAQEAIDALLTICRCQRQTAGRLAPARRATSKTGRCSAENSTIFAR